MTFIYGDHDWMDPAGAARVVAALRAAGGQPATPGDLQVFTTADSGHYTFLDQPEDFQRLMTTTCQPYADQVRACVAWLYVFRCFGLRVLAPERPESGGNAARQYVSRVRFSFACPPLPARRRIVNVTLVLPHFGVESAVLRG